MSAYEFHRIQFEARYWILKQLSQPGTCCRQLLKQPVIANKAAVL